VQRASAAGNWMVGPPSSTVVARPGGRDLAGSICGSSARLPFDLVTDIPQSEITAPLRGDATVLSYLTSAESRKPFRCSRSTILRGKLRSEARCW
jgi:hypothetical protein